MQQDGIPRLRFATAEALVLLTVEHVSKLTHFETKTGMVGTANPVNSN